MQDVWSKLARWLIFTVVLSALPLLLDFVMQAADGSAPPLESVVARGELALVCTALAGVAIGELLGLSDQAKITKIVLGGSCFLSAILAIALYIAMRSINEETGSPLLNGLSFWLYFATVISSTWSIVVSEQKK